MAESLTPTPKFVAQPISKASGDLKAAVKKDRQALDVYPYLLRALVFMGTSRGEAGEVQRATEVLRFAVQSFQKILPLNSIWPDAWTSTVRTDCSFSTRA